MNQCGTGLLRKYLEPVIIHQLRHSKIINRILIKNHGGIGLSGTLNNLLKIQKYNSAEPFKNDFFAYKLNALKDIVKNFLLE